MSLWERVMSWLTRTTPYPNEKDAQIRSLREQDTETRKELKAATEETEKLRHEMTKVSQKQQKRVEDIKVVMDSVIKKLDSASIQTAEEALAILKRVSGEENDKTPKKH